MPVAHYKGVCGGGGGHKEREGSFYLSIGLWPVINVGGGVGADRQTDKETDRQTETKKDRQTDRQSSVQNLCLTNAWWFG